MILTVGGGSPSRGLTVPSIGGAGENDEGLLDEIGGAD